MVKSFVITARIESETNSRLKALSNRLGRSRAAIIGEAVAVFVEEQAAFLEFVDEGERDIEEGRVLGQQEVTAWLDDMIVDARQRLARAKAA